MTEHGQWPTFAADEIEAVARVLRSGRVNYWTGEEGRQFEHEFAAACGARYGVALANGSVAIELALRVRGIGPGGSETFLKQGGQIEFTQSAIVLESLVNKFFANMASKGPDEQKTEAEQKETK